MFVQRLFCGVFSALVLLSSWGTATAQDDAKSMLQVARKQESMARGKKGEERERILREACVIYRKVPETWPESTGECARAWLALGRLNARLKDGKSAREAYEAVVDSDAAAKMKIQALEGLAGLARRAKDWKGALELLQSIVSGYPDHPRSVASALLAQGKIYRRTKKWQAAMAKAEKVLSTFPTLWRSNVAAADLALGVLTDTRHWPEAIAKLAEYDRLLEKRFQGDEAWPRVQAAMAKMRGRRRLTPLPL